METVVLKGGDFTTVHNTLCQLRDIEMQLNGVINEQMVQRLHDVVKGFEAGLRDAYAQDHRAFERKMNHYSDVREQQRFLSNWSIYEVEDLNSEHEFTGALQIAYKDHWGTPQFVEIRGKTWLDLYRAADECIRESGDHHHTFIEGFHYHPQEPQQLILVTGS